MKTWNVTARNKFEWGEGDYGDEWEPQSRDKILYLGREEDDELEWTLTKKFLSLRLTRKYRPAVNKMKPRLKKLAIKAKNIILTNAAAGFIKMEKILMMSL